VLPRLVTATTRDDITRILLDFLGGGFSRVILFVHAHGVLRGHDCRGPDLLPDAVREVRIPTSQPSIFSSVVQKTTPFFGVIRTETAIDRTFVHALGGATGNSLLFPVVLGERVPLLLFAHGSPHPVDPGSIQDLGEGVSSALARVIAAQRKPG
jgi:hypothetical protein